MQRYEEYKDSDFKWFGDIPKNWEVKRLKYLFKFVVGFTPPSGKSEYYEDGNYTWITIADMKSKYLDDSVRKITDKAIEDLNPCIVPKDSLLYSFKLSVGKVAFTEIDTYTNEAIFAVLPNEDLNLDFYYYALPLQIIHNANENIYGAKIFNQELIKNAFLVTPPKDEQITIANYLNKKTTEIDTLITQKEALLALYEEEKAAIINQAVTKGVDLDVTMKASGASWLDEMPKHWEVRRIGYSFGIIGSGTTPKTSESSYYYNGDIPWLNTGDLNNGYIYDTSKKITDKAIEDISTLKIYPIGSLVIAMYGATIGKLGITEIETTVNQACCVLNNSDVLSNKYLFYWLILNKRHIITLGSGGGQPNISQEIIRNLKVQTPPREEQDKIVEYIENGLSKIDVKIQKTKDIIKFQKEYRTALISEVVTGKIKVSEEM